MQLRPLKVATLTRSPPPWGRFARESSGLPDRGPPQAVGEVLRHIEEPHPTLIRHVSKPPMRITGR